MNPQVIDDMGWAMAEVYASVTDRILINLAHHFPYIKGGHIPGSFEYQARMLAQMGQVNRETIQLITQMLGGADEALRRVLEESIIESLKGEEPALRAAAERGLLHTPRKVNLDPGTMQAFQSYYRQSADKLNLVNTVMLESTQMAYQATVADVAAKLAVTQSALNVAAGEVITGVSTYNQALKTAVSKMVTNGLTGYVDHAGRRWSPEAYVAMDIRTTAAQTARSAVWERNEEYGNDLYLVSSHDGARPLCFPWQGKIISTSGRRGQTTDLDGNTYTIHSEDEIESFRYGGGLFGVNCGHYPMVWVEGFSTMKGEPQSEEANSKAYEESQHQRALERRLREEKRDLEVMKAQGASPEEIQAQRERIRNASADIDDFCDQTGRTRRRDREGAPVRATWPEGAGEVTRYNGGYIDTGMVPPPKGPINPPPAVAPPAAPPSKPPQGVVQSAYGEPFTRGSDPTINAKVENAENVLANADERARKVWEKVSPDLKAPAYDADPGVGDAYFSPSDGLTHYKDWQEAFNESSYQRDNTVFFHEYGHNIDHLLSGSSENRRYYSFDYQGNAFGKMLTQECEDRVREWYFRENGFTDAYDMIRAQQGGSGGMGFGSYIRSALRSIMPPDEYRAVRGMLLDAGDDDSVLRPFYDKYLTSLGESELRATLHNPLTGRDFIEFVKSHYSIYERSDVSDMFERYAVEHWGIDYPFGIGHGAAYTKRERSLSTEAFAEMYSATVTQSDSMTGIRDFFPQSYALFLKMLEEAI